MSEGCKLELLGRYNWVAEVIALITGFPTPGVGKTTRGLCVTFQKSVKLSHGNGEELSVCPGGAPASKSLTVE